MKININSSGKQPLLGLYIVACEFVIALFVSVILCGFSVAYLSELSLKLHYEKNFLQKAIHNVSQYPYPPFFRRNMY